MPEIKQPIWPRAGLVRASVIVHAGAVLGLGVPQSWPWIAGMLLSDHALLMAGSLWPRSTWVGPNLRRLPLLPSTAGKMSLTFDDGPDPTVTPQILEQLDQHGARASFFCVARRAEAFPDIVAEIARRGHRVENHSYSHSNRFALMGWRALGRELDCAQEVLTRQAGSAPRWFRAPAGLRSPWLDTALRTRDLELVSWTRRAFDTVSTDPVRIVNRLIRRLAERDILVLHDGGSAPDTKGRPVVLEVLPRLLDRIDEAGLRSIPIPPSLPENRVR